jgi:hypothetical protein
MASIYQDFTDDLQRKEERLRTQTINGVDYKIQCKDPYGYWYFVGQVGEVLRGAFTGADLAWRAAEAYEAARPVPVERTIISTDGKGNKKRIPQDSLLTTEI